MLLYGGQRGGVSEKFPINFLYISNYEYTSGESVAGPIAAEGLPLCGPIYDTFTKLSFSAPTIPFLFLY